MEIQLSVVESHTQNKKKNNQKFCPRHKTDQKKCLVKKQFFGHSYTYFLIACRFINIFYGQKKNINKSRFAKT